MKRLRIEQDELITQIYSPWGDRLATIPTQSLDQNGCVLRAFEEIYASAFKEGRGRGWNEKTAAIRQVLGIR